MDLVKLILEGNLEAVSYRLLHNMQWCVILRLIEIKRGKWVQTHFFVVGNNGNRNKGNIGGLITG